MRGRGNTGGLGRGGGGGGDGLTDIGGCHNLYDLGMADGVNQLTLNATLSNGIGGELRARVMNFTRHETGRGGAYVLGVSVLRDGVAGELQTEMVSLASASLKQT